MKTTQERIITKMHKHDLWKQKTNLMLFEAVYENHHKPTNQLYYQDKEKRLSKKVLKHEI